MKQYKPNEIHNIAVLGHQGSGKTSLMETILFATNTVTRHGSVDDGSTVSDYTKEEKNQKISIYSTVLPVEWEDSKYNFLDTPGFFDFAGEVNGVLRVARNAIIVVDAVKGVEVGTRRAWRKVRAASLPTIIFVNKMDKENIDFDKVLADIRETLGKRAVPFCWPIGHGEKFEGFVNVVDMKARIFDGKESKDADIWEEKKQHVEKLHTMIVESVANIDDELMMKYLEGEEITQDEINMALREGVRTGELVPVIVGSSTKNVGVRTLLNMISKYLPSEADARAPFGESVDEFEIIERQVDANEPFSALIFKTIIDPFIGKISFVSVRSGTLKKDQAVLNSTQGEKDKINNIAFIRGKEQIETNEIPAGDIGIIMKLSSANTGDTICDPSKPIRYEPVSIIPPSIFYSLLVKNKNDEGKIGDALRKIAAEDISIVVERNAETKQLLVGCQGKFHIDTVCEKLKSVYSIVATLEDAKVSFRETIKGTADVEGRYVKQSGGSGQYGVVNIKFEPCSENFVFVNSIFGGSVPSNYVPAVEKGLVEALKVGPLAGFPVLGVKATLHDGKYHAVDSSELAFKMAASFAFREACKTAKLVLLEPIMEVRVTVPNEYVGDIMGDLTKRRGLVSGTEVLAEEQIILAEVPQLEVLTYIIDLKTMTQGQATFTMKFIRYDEVPQQMMDKILKSLPKEEE